MSILIDDLIKDIVQENVGNCWYIAKPLNKISFIQRIKDAISVFYGNARAYHYFQDEAETMGEVK